MSSSIVGRKLQQTQQIQCFHVYYNYFVVHSKNLPFQSPLIFNEELAQQQITKKVKKKVLSPPKMSLHCKSNSPQTTISKPIVNKQKKVQSLHKVKKKKKIAQCSNQIQTKSTANIENLIKQSNSRIKKQKQYEKLQILSQKIDKIKRQQFLESINEKIRSKNAIRTNKSPSQSQNRLPWGSNEERLKKIALKLVERIYKNKEKKNRHEIDRRKALGLTWLNNFDEQKIIQLKKKKILPDSHKSIQSEKKKPYYDENKIIKFMQEKRKQQEQLSLQNKVMQLLQKKRRQENLSRLNEDVREIFNRNVKCRISEHSTQQTPKQINNYSTSDKADYLKQQYHNLAKRFQNAISTNSTNQIEKLNLNETHMEILQFHFVNEAATMIQKFWRGYFTRKVLSMYLQMVYEQQEEGNVGDQMQMQSSVKEGEEVKSEDISKQDIKIDDKIQEECQLQKLNEENRMIESSSNDLQNQILNQIQQEFQKSEQAQLESLFKKNEFSQNNIGLIEEVAEKIKSIHSSTQSNIIQLMQQLISSKRVKSHSDQYQSRDIEQERNFNENRKFLNMKEENSPNSMKKKELSEIILMKEQSIDLRLKSQQELLKDMFESNQISKEIYENQLATIEQWAQNEQNELSSQRKSIESTWKKAGEAYRKIQRDLKITSHLGNSQNMNLETNEELIKLQKEFNDQLQQIEFKKKKLFGSLLDSKSEQIKIIDNFEVKISNSDFFSIYLHIYIKDQDHKFEKLDHSFFEEEGPAQQNQNSQKNCVLINDSEFRPDNDEQILKDSENQLEIYQRISMVTTGILDIILDDLCFELHEKKLLRLKPPDIPGIQTSLASISSYIDSVYNFVITNCVQDVIQNINQFYGFSAIRRMKLIHGYDDCFDQSQDSSSSFLNCIAFVLDENLFLQFEQYRLKQSQLSTSESQELIEFEHIHNKVIFDAMNEILNTFRPFYFSRETHYLFIDCGIPYPWEKFGGSENLRFILKDQLPDIFRQTKSKVLEIAGMYCGFFEAEKQNLLDKQQISPEKQQIIQEKNHQVLSQQIHNSETPLAIQIFNISSNIEQSFDQEQLQSIREERLYKMLINDIKENEFKWYNYGDDETELKMELADMIFENLVEEFSSEMVGKGVHEELLDYE